ncbi:hypothetical protein ACE6H2_007023 [Prunus campanulata]
MQHNVQVEDETGVEDNVDVEDKDEAEIVDSEEDDGEFVDSDYEFSEEEFGFKTVEVPVHEGVEDTMNGSNRRPGFEAPGEVSSDGEHTSDFDTESEGDGDDMEGDNERTSKAVAAQNGNVGQNEVQAADNGNAGQNDIAPAQTDTAPVQTDTAPTQIETNAAPTQTNTAPTQIEVIRRRGRGRGLWNPAARMSSSQPVVSDISQGMANLPMTYSQQVPLQPSSSSLT